MTFMDLQRPEYSYMFGFLQMDGHLAAGKGQKGRLAVELSYQDRDLLHEFQRLTPYYSTVRERTRTTNFVKEHRSAIWTLCALEARQRLVMLGMPSGRKSASVAPPRTPYSPRDYLRGVIDADGSVGRTATGDPFLALTSASPAVTTFLCCYARLLTGAQRNPKPNARDSVFNVLYTKETAVALAQHLYYPGCLALGRKQRSADAISSWLRPPGTKQSPAHHPWRKDEDQVLLSGISPEAAAERLGRPLKGCRLRLWRLRTGRAGSVT